MKRQCRFYTNILFALLYPRYHSYILHYIGKHTILFGSEVVMARLTVVKGHIAVGLWGQNLGRFFFII